MATTLQFQGPCPALTPPAGPQLILVGHSGLLKWEHDRLSDPHWRWYWNDRPGAEIIVHKKRVALDPGHVVLIPPLTPFATRTLGLVGHFHIHFSHPFPPPGDVPPVFRHRPGAAEAALIRQTIAALHRASDADHRAVAFAAHQLVSAALLRVPASHWGTGTTDAAVEKALKHLHDHAPYPVSNHDLARLCGLGVSTLLRRFRAAKGIPPHRYLEHLRLLRVEELLRRSELSIEEIAAATGYCDRYHLTRAFTRRRGLGPAAYRRMHHPA